MHEFKVGQVYRNTMDDMVIIVGVFGDKIRYAYGSGGRVYWREVRLTFGWGLVSQ